MSKELCRSCGCEILWVKTENGKDMPVDTEPVETGNIMLQEERGKPVAMYVGPPDKNQLDLVPFPRYVSHFATCEYADYHRKVKR